MKVEVNFELCFDCAVEVSRDNQRPQGEFKAWGRKGCGV